mmetsp:Transcript_68492/g.214088  ORF Transcript_68492/g.214088 Transcript_68492/m.214088 type:complete len:238 (-) Transcript_68492:4149-4862(-)
MLHGSVQRRGHARTPAGSARGEFSLRTSQTEASACWAKSVSSVRANLRACRGSMCPGTNNPVLIALLLSACRAGGLVLPVSRAARPFRPAEAPWPQGPPTCRQPLPAACLSSGCSLRAQRGRPPAAQQRRRGRQQMPGRVPASGWIRKCGPGLEGPCTASSAPASERAALPAAWRGRGSGGARACLRRTLRSTRSKRPTRPTCRTWARCRTTGPADRGLTPRKRGARRPFRHAWRAA